MTAPTRAKTMGRKRGSTPLHGWLAIDKPLGMSSAAVVAKVLRATDAGKAGHGGTLDPLATGVLPIALGEATKTVAFVMDGAKTYRFKVRWGAERSTDDAEGAVVASSDARPAQSDIEALLPRFQGEIQQTPPAFSAIKLAGKRAYEIARADETPALVPRTVRIDRLVLLFCTADEAEFEVDCGKGTYIRSLARDFGRILECFGSVSALRRTRCGPFREDGTISLDMLNDFGHSAASANLVLPVETALDDIPALALTEDEARRLQSGQSLSVLRLAACRPLPSISAGTTLRAMAEGRVVALARIDGDELRSVRVLNL